MFFFFFSDAPPHREEWSRGKKGMQRLKLGKDDTSYHIRQSLLLLLMPYYCQNQALSIQEIFLDLHTKQNDHRRKVHVRHSLLNSKNNLNL